MPDLSLVLACMPAYEALFSFDLPYRFFDLLPYLSSVVCLHLHIRPQDHLFAHTSLMETTSHSSETNRRVFILPLFDGDRTFWRLG